MSTVQEMAIAIDDGYRSLVTKREELAASKKAHIADAKRYEEEQPSQVAARWLAGGVDLTEAARHEVAERRHEDEIGRVTSVYLLAAERALIQASADWMQGHESPLCAELHRARVAVQDRAGEVLRDRRPDLDRVDVLAKEWADLRREHLSLTGISPWDRSTHWRGLDWVENYVEAWPQFFLAWELQVVNADGKPRSEGPARAPFDPEVDSSEFIAMPKLTPLEQMTQLVSVRVWTPTKRAYSQKLALLDDAANRRRYDYAAEAKQPVTKNVRPGSHVTTTAPAWFKEPATPLTSRK